MAAGKLDDISANVASNSPLPLRVEKPIIAANNRSTTDRGVFGQREGRGEWVSCLGPKPIEGGRDGVIVAVGVEEFSRNVDINPLQSQLLIRLAQSLVPVRICHVGLLLTLVIEAASGGWNRGAQINQMSNRSPSRDQRTAAPPNE
jgi:hypothetical protein